MGFAPVSSQPFFRMTVPYSPVPADFLMLTGSSA
jgi:hypothetical protein